MNPRRLAVPVLASVVLVLAGCATSDATPGETADGTVQVVASTNVYGDIAAAIGGDRVTVASIIDSLAQDPHSYEASARDQLTVSRADLIIENGGGYDAFLASLVEATGTEAEVISAVELSHAWPDADHDHADDHDPSTGSGTGTDSGTATDSGTEGDDHDHDHEHIEGFNEHVWYDPHTVAHLAEEIAEHLTELDPQGASLYEGNLAEFTEGIEALETSLEALAADHAGTEIFVTEPVPLYLTDAAGLVNVAPDDFTEAVEEGQDVAPATLLESLNLIKGGTVATVIVNAQTGGAETTQIIAAAEQQGIATLEFSELLPADQTYLTWMQANIEALESTLTR